MNGALALVISIAALAVAFIAGQRETRRRLTRYIATAKTNGRGLNERVYAEALDDILSAIRTVKARIVIRSRGQI